MKQAIRTAVQVAAVLSLVSFCAWQDEPKATAAASPTISRLQILHAGAATAHGLAVVDDSTFLVSESYADEDRFVFRIKASDADEDQLQPVTSDPLITIPMIQPCGLALSPNHKTLYICDTAASRVYVHDAPTGRLKDAIDTAGMPWNVRVIADGSWWYLTADGRLHRRTSDGRTSLVMNRETRKPVEISTAFDFVIHPKTRELVVTQQEPGRVIAVDSATGESRVIADGLQNPEGIDVITFNDQAYFIVAETSANRIMSIEDREGIRPVTLLDGIAKKSNDGADQASVEFKLPICVRSTDSHRVIITARTIDGNDPLILICTLSTDD